MSWAENEKLNEWIERAFENGRAEERERIIKLLERQEELYAVELEDVIALIKGEINE